MLLVGIFLGLFVVAGLCVGAAALLEACTDLDGEGWFVVAVLVGAVAVLYVPIPITVGAVGFTAQIDDIEAVERTIRTERIMERRAEELTGEIRVALIEQYPEYEQQVIDDVLETDPQLILLRFPELRSSDTFIQYTKDLKRLRSAVYEQETEREALLAEMRARERNVVNFIPAFIPDPPEREDAQ